MLVVKLVGIIEKPGKWSGIYYTKGFPLIKFLMYLLPSLKVHFLRSDQETLFLTSLNIGYCRQRFITTNSTQYIVSYDYYFVFIFILSYEAFYKIRQVTLIYETITKLNLLQL